LAECAEIRCSDGFVRPFRPLRGPPPARRRRVVPMFPPAKCEKVLPIIDRWTKLMQQVNG
jgi:hypothetical protein